MLVRDIMSGYPAYIRLGADIRRAAEMIGVSEVGHLMVLDHEDRFVGQLSEDDLVRALFPRYDDVLASGGTLEGAFALFVERGREIAERPVDPLVVRDPVTVGPDDEVARAAVAMTGAGVRRLPVVEGGALVGTVSRADVCRAVIYHR